LFQKRHGAMTTKKIARHANIGYAKNSGDFAVLKIFITFTKRYVPVEINPGLISTTLHSHYRYHQFKKDDTETNKRTDKE